MPRGPVVQLRLRRTGELSSPRIFLFRMLVFLTLCALLLVVLYKQIWARSSPIPD